MIIISPGTCKFALAMAGKNFGNAALASIFFFDILFFVYYSGRLFFQLAGTTPKRIFRPASRLLILYMIEI